MVNKHFFKTLILFTLMILLGLVGILLVNRYADQITKADLLNNKAEVAK